MSAIAHDSRIESLAAQLRASAVDAFLAWHPVTMSYLHGFGESAHERFLTLAIRATGDVALICPGLTENQARRCGVRDIRSWRDGDDPIALFKSLADEWELKTAIIAVDDDLPAHMLLAMQEALPAALFKPGQEILGRLMVSKASDEIALMRKAAQVADDSCEAIYEAIRPGKTEAEIGDVIAAEMRKRGGTPHFAIVAAGKNGAEPHHESDETTIQEGDVVILDFGCTVGGYVSDITRVVCCGYADEEQRKVYEIVHRAHEAARVAAKPGATGAEVDAAARKVIEDAGYGEFFVHRTGHGIGMRGHEDPYIVNTNTEPLVQGSCFSIEPGIYLPGKFGVRLENIYTMTESGAVSLNADYSATLQELAV